MMHPTKASRVPIRVTTERKRGVNSNRKTATADAPHPRIRNFERDSFTSKQFSGLVSDKLLFIHKK